MIQEKVFPYDGPMLYPGTYTLQLVTEFLCGSQARGAKQMAWTIHAKPAFNQVLGTTTGLNN
jgi:hypothetical protein